MKKFIAVLTLRSAIIMGFLIGAVLCAFVYPFLVSLSVSGFTPSGEMSESIEAWVRLASLWCMTVPLFVLLVYAFKLSNLMSKYKFFSADSVRLLSKMSFAAFLGGALILIGGVILSALGYDIRLDFYIMLALASAAFSFLLSAFSRILRVKASTCEIDVTIPEDEYSDADEITVEESAMEEHEGTEAEGKACADEPEAKCIEITKKDGEKNKKENKKKEKKKAKKTKDIKIEKKPKSAGGAYLAIKLAVLIFAAFGIYACAHILPYMAGASTILGNGKPFFSNIGRLWGLIFSEAMSILYFAALLSAWDGVPAKGKSKKKDVKEEKRSREASVKLLVFSAVLYTVGNALIALSGKNSNDILFLLLSPVLIAAALVAVNVNYYMNKSAFEKENEVEAMEYEKKFSEDFIK